MDSSSSQSSVSQGGGRSLGSASGATATSPVASRRKERTKPVEESQCQVEGCGAKLSGGKLYHLRHRVCPGHSKSPAVVVAGRTQRFCQQCSRFHDLGEFDEDKRSCRRRLAGHNQRRRKPVPILPTLVHYPMQFVAPSSYGGQLTIGHGIHRPSMHFNSSVSKPTRTGYDSSVSGCAVASSGLVPFNSEPPMPSFPSVAYERRPYGYNAEPVRQRLPLDHGYSDDGSEAGNSFGTSDSERVLSVFCQGDETGLHSTMLHLH